MELLTAPRPVQTASAAPVPRGLPLLSDYPRFVWRNKLILALCTGVGLMLGYAFAAAQPPTFSATAHVVLIQVPVYVNPATEGLVPPEVTIDTDAQLLRSARVLGAIADTLGIEPAEAEQHLSVTATPSSHVLHITVAARTAVLSRRAADAAADAFVDERREALGALRSSQLRQLRLYVAEQQKTLASEQKRRLVIPGQDDLFAEVMELQEGLDELEAARSVPAQVVGPADDPERADHANAEVPITSGAMLGLVAGWLLGLGRDRLRRARPTDSPPYRLEDGHHATWAS
jgi:uncharacterized protein involved in exopolysaccharide biosynthesis